MNLVQELADLWDPYGYFEIHRYKFEGAPTWRITVGAHEGMPRGPKHFDSTLLNDALYQAHIWVEAKVRAFQGVPKPSPA
jgi:hypothetical protein